MSSISLCISCQPTQNDMGWMAAHTHRCWYAAAAAEALRAMSLASIGMSPVALTLTPALMGDSVGTEMFGVASEPSDDYLQIQLAEESDIPRLVRRWNGFERHDSCGYYRLATPLTKTECKVVQIARAVTCHSEAREALAEMTSEINDVLTMARFNTKRLQRETAVDYVFKLHHLRTASLLPSSRFEECDGCPDSRPDQDEVIE